MALPFAEFDESDAGDDDAETENDDAAEDDEEF